MLGCMCNVYSWLDGKIRTTTISWVSGIETFYFNCDFRGIDLLCGNGIQAIKTKYCHWFHFSAHHAVWQKYWDREKTKLSKNLVARVLKIFEKVIKRKKTQKQFWLFRKKKSVKFQIIFVRNFYNALKSSPYIGKTPCLNSLSIFIYLSMSVFL